MDLLSYELAQRIGEQNVLVKMDKLLNWAGFRPIIERGLGRSGQGPSGYDLEVMWRCMLLGQWYNLSDPKLEESLRVRIDFLLFAKLDVWGKVPDETTLCRFRNALVAGGVFDELLEEVCRQLEVHELKVNHAQAAIIDATLIQTAARPKVWADQIAQDRQEQETGGKDDDPPNALLLPDPAVSEQASELDKAVQAEGQSPVCSEKYYCADTQARWLKKGRQSTLGYKGFARCDGDGFVDKVHVTPANKAESPEFETMVDGAKADRILADKAYASRKNRAYLKKNPDDPDHPFYKDGIMRKAARGRPLRASEKRFNKLISKQRYRIEQTFGTAKRLFGLQRARYFGIAKTHAQMAMTAIAINLLKAANLITLNPKPTLPQPA